MADDALKVLAPKLQELDEADVKRPDVPVAIFVSEGLAMLEALSKKGALVKAMQEAGLDADVLTKQAPQAISALSLAQASWIGHRRGLTAQDIIDKLKEGYEERADALLLCDFYARKKREAQGRLAAIREGEGDADMVEDLRALAAFYTDEAALFAARKKFDPKEEAQRLTKLADALGPLLESNLIGTARRDALSLRDRAYTHADAILDELRGYGRLVTARKGAADRAIFANHYINKSLRRSRAR